MKKLFLLITALFVVFTSLEAKPRKGEGIVPVIKIDTSMTMDWEGYNLNARPDSLALYSGEPYFIIDKETSDIVIQFVDNCQSMTHGVHGRMTEYIKDSSYYVYFLRLFNQSAIDDAFDKCPQNPYRCLLMEAIAVLEAVRKEQGDQWSITWHTERVALTEMLANYMDE